MVNNVQSGSLSSTRRYDGPQTFQPMGALLRVAIVIVLDATGSMASCIAGVKLGLMGMIDILMKGGMKADLGLVVFRDELINEMPECYDVGTPPEKLKAVLAATKAIGGGDEPESSLPAIRRALNLQGYPVGAKKVVFHLTDASAHDPESGLSSRQVLAMLKEQQVAFFACTPQIQPYTQFVAETKGRLFPLTAGLKADAFKGIVHRFSHETVRTLRMGDGMDFGEAMRNELRKTHRIR